MAMIKKYQKGNKVEYPILSKVLLNRNKDLDFVKRINDSSKSISNEDGSISTHLMRAEIDDKGNWYMFPQIVNQQGTLKDLGEGSFDYALKSGENISVPNKDLAIWLASNNYKNMNKFQQGGPIDFTQLLGGDWQSLFSSFLNPQGAQPTGYGVEGENYDNQDDFLRAYHENEIDEEFEDKWFFPKARANRQKKKLNKSIESGEIYDDPNTQNITNQGRMEGIGNYFQSPDFLAGLSDLGNQYKDYQQNLKSEKFNMPVDHSGYKVGQDRGFQVGGYVGPAQSFILDSTKIASDDLTRFSAAIREHESFSDYTRVQDSGGPGRGAYQFDTPSLKTAAKKAKRIYKTLGTTAPSEFDDIIKGKIKDATQLHPELQDELFFSSLTKVKPVKDKNGRIKRYDIVPLPSLGKYDYGTPDGMANAWQRLHNRGRVDRTSDFITSLSRLGEYQQGGDVRVSTQGYKKGSPDKNEDSLIIPGGNITMEGVDQSLLLLPSNGQAVLAGPNSGDYNFPGADYVKEIPMKKGGYPLYQMGGEVQPLPIQTEKGEMLSFADGTLTPVKAKKRHKSMGADEATDIVPEGTYVFSRDKSMILNKKDADEISLGYGPIKYEEGKNSEAPREVFFGEIFNKKTQTPASVGKAIKRLYPVTEREDDAFAEQAKQENKVSRFPYIEALKHMSEMKKNKPVPQYQMGGSVNTFNTSLGNLYRQPTPQYGDPALKRDNNLLSSGTGQPPSLHNRLPSYQSGGVAALATILPDAINNFQMGMLTWQQMQDLKKNQAQTEQELDKFRADQTGRNQMGMQLGAASALAQHALQDPSYTYADFGEEQALASNAFQGIQDRMNTQRNQLRNKQQAPINTMYRNMAMNNPNMAANVAGSMYGQYLDQSGMNELQMMDKANALDLNRLGVRSNIAQRKSTDQQQGRMYEKSATNLLNQGLAQGLAGAGQNYLTQESQNALTNISGKMGARNQTFSGLGQLGYLQAHNMASLTNNAGSLAQLYNPAYNNNNQQQPTTPPQTNPYINTGGMGYDMYQNTFNPNIVGDNYPIG